MGEPRISSGVNTEIEMTERQRGQSLLRLVCDYLQKNPEEELTRSDIATKFNVQSSIVDSELKAAVNAGRLAVERNEDDGLVWRLGGPKVSSPAPFAAGERAAKSARLAKMRATLAVDL